MVQTSAPRAGSPPSPAQQPYTRRAHAIDDQLLPQHHPRKHHVDIRVLDALARRLEGWHRSWIAIEIRTLVYEAGVSQASVTRALARLQTAGVIMRRRKPTPRGRYIWEIALGETYRTASPAQEAAPRHGTVTCQDDMHGKEKEQRVPPQSLPHEQKEDDESLSRHESTTGDKTGNVVFVADAPEPEAPAASSEEKAPRQTPGPPPVARAGASRSGDSRAKNAALEPEQLERRTQLIQAGVLPRMAERLVRAYPLPTIARELEHLPQRLGVRDPARYLVAAIMDGNFAPPEPSERLADSTAHASVLDRIRHEEEQARQRQEQARQVEEAARAAAEQQTEEDWSRLLALPGEVREQLIATARTLVRGAAAQAPWDALGPLRGALLNVYAERFAPDRVPELLHTGPPRLARRGEMPWGLFRRPPRADTG